MKPLSCFLTWVLTIYISSYCLANDNSVQDSTFYFTSNFSPNQVDLSIHTATFSLQKNRRFNFWLTSKYCYIVVKVKGSKPVPYHLSLDNTSLDEVFIYSLHSNGTKQFLYKGGNTMPYNTNRLYVWHTASIITKEQPSYYLIAVKTLAQNIILTYQILPDAELRNAYKSLDRLIYFYSGIILLITLISFIGYLVFKRKTLLIYCGYVLAVAAWILAHYGYMFAFIYPTLPIVNAVIKPASSLLAMLCLLNLITQLIKQEKKGKWMSNALFFSKIITASLIIIYLVHLFSSFTSIELTVVNIVWHLSILFSIASIGIVLALNFKSSKTVKIFSIGIGLLLLAAFFQIFSNAGLVYSPFLNEHAMVIGSLLEMAVLTFGIFYNLWEEKRDKEEELKIAERERSRAFKMLISVQDEERKHIAEDLHDSIGPMLAAIKINFLRMAKAKAADAAIDNLVAKTENIIDESIAEIRNIAHQLMPKGLSSKGLITLLNDYFTNLQTIYALRINFTHTINVALEKDVQLNLYRIISELSLNAAKHSEAKTLTVSMETLPEETLVVIRDDGKGFRDELKESTSLGIKNVRSRVDYLGGKVHLNSLPGKGTTIQISIPHK